MSITPAFGLHFSAGSGAKQQTVLQHGKATPQHIALK
jgi:hypothetical protein